MLKISEEGLRRLQEVKAYVMEEPRRFVMETIIREGDTVAPCGTACCIAGHLLLLDMQRTKLELSQHVLIGNWVRLASRLLGFENLLDASPSALFHVGQWPREYRNRYNPIGDQSFWTDEVITEALASGRLRNEDFVNGVWGGFDGPNTLENVADARINNATVMCELIDEICAKGGLWWVRT